MPALPRSGNVEAKPDGRRWALSSAAAGLNRRLAVPLRLKQSVPLPNEHGVDPSTLLLYAIVRNLLHCRRGPRHLPAGLHPLETRRLP